MTAAMDAQIGYLVRGECLSAKITKKNHLPSITIVNMNIYKVKTFAINPI